MAFLETLITAVLAFASTNIDDLFVLMLLFTQVSASFTKRSILYGQYLGIGSLIAISIAGSLIGIVIPKEYIGLLGLFPVYLGIRKLFSHEQTDNVPVLKSNNGLPLLSWIDASAVSVASITIANGADNIGIYIPLFVNLNWYNLLLTIITFLLMVYLWVKAAAFLILHPNLKVTLSRYNHILFPVILIGLGIYILIQSGTYTILLK
jgi:cadmium resistance protein CadD (predicted permease)